MNKEVEAYIREHFNQPTIDKVCHNIIVAEQGVYWADGVKNGIVRRVKGGYRSTEVGELFLSMSEVGRTYQRLGK
jgi:hypothetical protein